MSFFKAPKMPEIASVTPPQLAAAVPTSAEDTEALEEEERRRLRRRRGSGTILTGPQGILNAPPVERKTLLGE